jgi:hypothetical protein
MSKVARLDDATVTLRGVRVALTSDIGRAYTTDCCRNWEKILPNNAICERYGLTVAEWQQMGANKQLVQAVRDEHQRRIKNGTAAQELAAKEFATGPKYLGEILRSPDSNPRHKIEAHRELRATVVGTGPEGSGANSELFSIVINMGADSEKLVIEGKVPPRTNKDWETFDGMAD